MSINGCCNIDDAITKGLIKNSPIILFRIHPVDKYERWKDIVENSKNIIIQFILENK